MARRLIYLLFIISLLSNCGGKQEHRLNILFAISDDQSYPHAGAYGYKAALTPNFDRIANEGALFTNAFSAAPGCSPSRASILTGRHIWQIEEAGSHASGFPKQYVCFTDLLDSAGYHVGFTNKGWGPGNWKVSGRTRNPAGTEYSGIKDENAPEHINKTDYAANFEAFLKDRKAGQPFCFWYGASEPHRRYKKGIGEANGYDVKDIVVPSFLPDVDDVKSDMADYLYEIHHFDDHLGLMIKKLEEIGELDNTIIIVTSDNGMPFPRAKANLYEFGFHMPLAIRWGSQIKAGRIVDDLVSLTDLAPTFLELAGVEQPSAKSGKYPMTGKSIADLLMSNESGIVDPSREAVFAGRERHSSSRWNNLSYPQRAVRTHNYLYIKNFKPERWPAGAPQKYDDSGQLSPGFHDIDDFAESYIYLERENPEVVRYFDWAVAKRPQEELYDIENDPGCLRNLTPEDEFEDVLTDHRNLLQRRLEETKDPRVTGNGDVWESYIRYSPIRTFPEPE
jgi:uncharacterized sulfatase